MRVITFATYTGGSGKSTSSTSMATVLAQKGYRTLFIDADKQCNSTSYMLCGNGKTFYDVMNCHRPLDNIKEAIQHCSTCDVIPGDTMTDSLNEMIKKFNNIEPNSGTLFLKRQLDTIDDEYDFCIFDTSYIVDEILYAVLAASDDIFVPMDVDKKSIQGFIALDEDIKKIRTINPNIHYAGCFLTRINPNKRVKNTEEFAEAARQITSLMGTILFNTRIRTSEAVRTAHNNGTSLIHTYPKVNATIDYINFVNEYLLNIGMPEKKGE